MRRFCYKPPQSVRWPNYGGVRTFPLTYIVGKKLGQTMERRPWILTPSELDRSFLVPKNGAKFPLNRVKIATVGTTTGRR